MSFCDRYPLLLTPGAIIILPRIHKEPVCPIVLGDTIQGPLLVAILCFIQWEKQHKHRKTNQEQSKKKLTQGTCLCVSPHCEERVLQPSCWQQWGNEHLTAAFPVFQNRGNRIVGLWTCVDDPWFFPAFVCVCIHCWQRKGIVPRLFPTSISKLVYNFLQLALECFSCILPFFPPKPVEEKN